MNMKLRLLSCSIALALCQGAIAQQKSPDSPSSPGAAAGSAAGKAAAATSYDEADYSRSMVKLQKAAQRLREAVQAMATRPAGERRNEAMRQANDALLETQQAMVQLPPELRKAAGADGSGGSGGSDSTAASGGSSAANKPSVATINAKVPVLVIRAKIIKPGQKVAELDEKLGFFENIRSMKVSCT